MDTHTPINRVRSLVSGQAHLLLGNLLKCGDVPRAEASAVSEGGSRTAESYPNGRLRLIPANTRWHSTRQEAPESTEAFTVWTATP
jgi:hypothetical protein